MRMAIAKANDLGIPLIVAGDLHDTKANLRGECVSAMIKTFGLCAQEPIVLRGNHDALNEKSKEHSLEFLSHLVKLIDEPQAYRSKPSGLGNYPVDTGVFFIPYQHDVNELSAILATVPKKQVIIMHQGLKGSNSGEYFVDRSAISVDDLAGRRVISGHYHNRQTTVLPEGGLHDFIGNPYTLTFGEANDPVKGFQVLYNDGSLEFVPTDLRKHIVIECHASDLSKCSISINPQDLMWVKLTGTTDELAKITKAQLAIDLDIPGPFKLDKIPVDTVVESQEDTPNVSNPELLDNLIDSLSNTDKERKERLKALWKEFV